MTHAIFTCSPYFTDLALNEIYRQHPTVIPLTEIAPGKILLHSPNSYHHLTRLWQDKPPIYLHHCCPVDKALILEDDPIVAIYQAAKPLIQSKHPVDVQTRIIADEQCDIEFPFSADDITDSVRRTIPEPQNADPRLNCKILSVTITYCQQKWWAYLGVSWPKQNLSPYPSGFRPIDNNLPNRAGYKLIEALDTFDINLRDGDRALDLGAAPGAWTMVLRQHGLHVTAVAPTAMYPNLRDDPMIDIFQGFAEDYLQQVESQFDLITNDMILDGQDAARLMIEYAKFLRTQGIAIMTLKLRRKNRRRVMDHSLRLLRKAYKIIRIRQLVHNRNEVTLFLRRKE